MAHLNAVKFEKAKGRYMLVGDCLWFKEIGEIVQESYGKNYTVCYKELPKALMWCATFWNPEAAVARSESACWTFQRGCPSTVPRINHIGHGQTVYYAPDATTLASRRQPRLNSRRQPCSCGPPQRASSEQCRVMPPRQPWPGRYAN